VKNAAQHTELMSVDPHFVGIAEATTTVSDSVMPQLAADVAVRGGDRNSIIAIIMKIGHLDRAHADELAEAIGVYLRRGVIDHGLVGEPAMSGALRLALAAVGRQAAPRADKVRPPPISTIWALMWVRVGLLATIAWSVLLAWLEV
jgi:hypothetical protein